MVYTRINETINPDETKSGFLYVKGEVGFEFDINKVHTLIITYYNKAGKILAFDDSGKEIKIKKEGKFGDEGSFDINQAGELIIFNHKEIGSKNGKKVDSKGN